MDPFPPTCNPDAYVAREATDRMLDALETGFFAGRRVMALSGPGGLGKTMVLRVLEARLAGTARCLHVVYAALSSDELVYWVLGLLGREPIALDPEGALYLAATDGLPLVLLVDDASALPPDTARDLVAWAHQFGGALRIVVASVDDDRADQVLAVLGQDVLDLRLREPMTEHETRRYVAARLDALPDPRAVPDRLSSETVAWLHRESAGNPRVLHGLATWLLYADSPVPSVIRADYRDWLHLDADRELAELEADSEPIERHKPDGAAALAWPEPVISESQPAVARRGAARSSRSRRELASGRRRRRRQRR